MESERFAVVILRFDDSIRQKNDGGAFLQLDLGGVRADRTANAEGEGGDLDAPRLLAFAQQVGIDMSDVGVPDRAAPHIKNREYEGHERATLGRSINETITTMTA